MSPTCCAEPSVRLCVGLLSHRPPAVDRWLRFRTQPHPQGWRMSIDPVGKCQPAAAPVGLLVSARALDMPDNLGLHYPGRRSGGLPTGPPES